MEKQTLNEDYIESFFGDTSEIPEMTDTELRRATRQLRKIWIRAGDYHVGVDPSAEEIFRYTRRLYPRHC